MAAGDDVRERVALAMAEVLVRIGREHPDVQALRQEALDAGVMLQVVGVDFVALAVPQAAKPDPSAPVPVGLLNYGPLPPGQIPPAPRQKPRVTVNDRRFLKSMRITAD
jgi:hypothetical protein